MAAYELLVSDGLVYRRRGSGTVVRRDASPDLPGEMLAVRGVGPRAPATYRR